MPDLPLHPITGIPALAVTRSGRPIWPIFGADGADDEEDGDDEKKPDKGDAKKPDKGDDETDWEAEARKWKALARKHEGQAKENADAAKRLKDLEDADKSEIDKAKERAAEADRKAAAAERRALVAEIAAEKGLTMSIARRLVGDTREELEADADELVEAFGTKGKGDKSGKNGEGDGKKSDARRLPKEQLRPGASGEDDDEVIDQKKAEEIADRISKSTGF